MTIRAKFIVLILTFVSVFVVSSSTYLAVLTRANRIVREEQIFSDIKASFFRESVEASKLAYSNLTTQTDNFKKSEAETLTAFAALSKLTVLPKTGQPVRDALATVVSFRPWLEDNAAILLRDIALIQRDATTSSFKSDNFNVLDFATSFQVRQLPNTDVVVSHAGQMLGHVRALTAGLDSSIQMFDTQHSLVSHEIDKIRDHGAFLLRGIVFIVGAASLIVVFFIYLLFSRSITKPLAKAVAFAELVASGDFTQQLPIRQRDEIGKLAAALNGMAMKLRDMVATIQKSAERVASSSQKITARSHKLAEGAQSQASTLGETSASVEELTTSVDQVAEHAQTQAAAVEHGSGSMAQVQRSFEDVSKNLTEIADLAGKSVDNALEGARTVSQVVDGINLIAGGSEKIGGIIALISDIADQTNLLALNASIEAARAGEHGRGFAVVADEVSKLADRSSTSTKEIEGLIKESTKNVTKGVETAKGSRIAMEQIEAASQRVQEMISGLFHSVNQRVATLKELSKALESVSDMSQSISAATEEQTASARQVSRAVENVNEVAQSAASAAEEVSASSEQLSQMAQQLLGMTAQFKIGVPDGAIHLSVSRQHG